VCWRLYRGAAFQRLYRDGGYNQTASRGGGCRRASFLLTCWRAAPYLFAAAGFFRLRDAGRLSRAGDLRLAATGGRFMLRSDRAPLTGMDAGQAR